MLCPHWIPAHRDASDKPTFARWAPAFVKVITNDETIPYLEDIPIISQIIVRHYRLSDPEVRRFAGARGIAAAIDSGRAFQQTGSGRDALAVAPAVSATVAALATPTELAIQHAQMCQRIAGWARARGVSSERLLFEGLNEPQLWAGEPPGMTAAYYAEFLRYMHAYGLHVVCGNFGVGWPGNGGVQDAPPNWVPFEPMLKAMGKGDYLGLHEYWALNGPGENWQWWAGRFLQCPWQVPILITECGIDTGVTGQFYGGWHDLLGTFEQKAKRYHDELEWYLLKGKTDGRVQGAFPFTYDMGSKDWEKFNTKNQPWLDQLWHQEVVTPPGWQWEPTPPDPEPSTSLEFDLRTCAWNAAGVAYNPDAAFCKFASAHNLGMPQTDETDMTSGGKQYRLQGFTGAIVYAEVGDWANVKALAW